MSERPWGQRRKRYQPDGVRAEGSLLHAHTSAVTWEPPQKRFGQRDGALVRHYVCLVCKDAGVVTLPRYHKGETDEEVTGVYLGTGVAYYCPACRAKASVYRLCVTEYEVIADEAGHPRWVQARLAHWLELRRAQIKKDQDLDAPTEKEVKAAVAKSVEAAKKPVPQQSTFEVEEEADAARRKEGAG